MAVFLKALVISDVNLPVKMFLVKNPLKNGYKISGKKSGTNPIKSLIKSLGARLQIIKKTSVLYKKVSENENRRNFLKEGSNKGKLEQKYG